MRGSMTPQWQEASIFFPPKHDQRVEVSVNGDGLAIENVPLALPERRAERVQRYNLCLVQEAGQYLIFAGRPGEE